MDNLKSKLSDIANQLKEVVDAGRKLPNQNFADIAEGARARIEQLQNHPDIDAIGKDDSNGRKTVPFGATGATGPTGSTGPAPSLFTATDPGAATQAAEAHRRDAFASVGATGPTGPSNAPTGVGSQVTGQFPGATAALAGPTGPTGPSNGPTGGDKETYHPGDPEFMRAGNSDAGARDPHNVDLNKDGTVQRAPGVAGASDVHKD